MNDSSFEGLEIRRGGEQGSKLEPIEMQSTETVNLSERKLRLNASSVACSMADKSAASAAENASVAGIAATPGNAASSGTPGDAPKRPAAQQNPALRMMGTH